MVSVIYVSVASSGEPAIIFSLDMIYSCILPSTVLYQLKVAISIFSGPNSMFEMTSEGTVYRMICKYVY